METRQFKSGLMRCYGLLSLVAAIVGLTTHSSRAITFGDPDEGKHPNVGALMIRWADGTGWPICSGTLIESTQTGSRWTGVYLTAGHCVNALLAWLQENAIALDNVKVNFDGDPDIAPGADVKVTDMDLLFVPRPNFADWEDMGLLIIEAEVELPEPATVAPPGFLDQFTQRQLQQSEFVAVGYGASLLFPPPEPIYYDQRQFSTPKYLNLLGQGIKLQVNGAAGNSGVLIGDSGGPLFMKDPMSGRDVIVAICHGGYGQFNSTAIHYRVDTEHAKEFIESH